MNPRNRPEIIKKLKNQEFDLLIIGGGINGCAMAQDAAMRGLKTALVEKGGFASGTSSRSSKLIHGGLRYLEHMEFGLVRESCTERNLLIKRLPHLVKPFKFFFPVFKKDRLPLFMVNMGIWLYDLISVSPPSRFHRSVSRKAVKESEPLIKTDDFKGGMIYYDAQANDARLVLETLFNADRYGAVVLNYAQAVSFRFKGKRINQVEIKDSVGGDSFFIQPKLVVNAAGPWVDQVLAMQAKKHKPVLRPTKGVHILFKRDHLDVRQGVVINDSKDKRLIFVMPWENHVLVGTTDTDYRDKLDHVAPTSDDVAYLLDHLNHYFPAAGLQQEHIISAYAGIRPLVSQSRKHASAVSRGDVIFQNRRGMITVAGGKLTTFRHMAYKTVKKVCRILNKKYGTYFSLQEITKNLPDREDVPPRLIDRLKSHLSLNQEASIKYLVSQYGSGVGLIVGILEKHPVLNKPVSDGMPFILAEAVYCARHETCESLLDFFRVHTNIYLLDPDHGRKSLSEVGLLFKEELNWTLPEFENQKKQYLDFIAENMAWRKSVDSST